MPAEANDKFTVSAPKSIMGMLALAVLGGGAMGMAAGARQADAVQAGPVGLTRAEVQQVATDAAAGAKGHADAVGATTRDDCRRDLSTATTTLNNTLIRLENKVDTLGVEVGELKVGVATMKARRGR